MHRRSCFAVALTFVMAAGATTYLAAQPAGRSSAEEGSYPARSHRARLVTPPVMAARAAQPEPVATSAQPAIIPQPQPGSALTTLPAPLGPLTQAEMPAQPPRVTYKKGVLTVDAPNATLGDILAAIHQATGAEFEPQPESTDRASFALSGPPAEVVAEILRGSQFGYVLLSAPDDPGVLQRVILAAREEKPGKTHAGAILAAAEPMPAIRGREHDAAADTEPDKEPATGDAPAVEKASDGSPMAPVPAQPMPVRSAEEAAAAAAEAAATAAAQTPLSQQGALVQQGIILPDPAQVVDRVNQQNAQNPDKPAVSPAAEYMQQLYRLRVAAGQTAATPAQASAPQQ